jgi:ubiquinone/menaquinone biosynthesis C-methylase UbiE
MEGGVARRYADQRRSGNQMEGYRRQAHELTARLPDGAEVLEVAPGPGYLAIEIARMGRFRVTGLDVSRTFVEIASRNAQESGVEVDFRHGDGANMPFDAESFDLVLTQAAFKNFSQPGRALEEFHRVLRAGGTAIIQDMSRGASRADIAEEVAGMALGRASTFMTKAILARLRRRAYSPLQFEQLIADSAFRTGEVRTGAISLDVRMKKPPAG